MTTASINNNHQRNKVCCDIHLIVGGAFVGTLKLSVWSVPNGTVDSQGVAQPAYLNFNLTLLAPPAGDVAEVCHSENRQ